MQVESKHLGAAEQKIDALHKAPETEVDMLYRQKAQAKASAQLNEAKSQLSDRTASRIDRVKRQAQDEIDRRTALVQAKAGKLVAQATDKVGGGAAKLSPKAQAKIAQAIENIKADVAAKSKVKIDAITKTHADELYNISQTIRNGLQSAYDDFKTISPEERRSMLSRHIYDEAGESIRKELEYLHNGTPEGLLKPDTELDWSKYKNVNQIAERMFGSTDNPLVKLMGFAKERVRAQISANYLPHGIGNVGFLSVMGNGLQVLPRFLLHLGEIAANPAYREENAKMLQEIGAHSSLTHGTQATSLLEQIPGAEKLGKLETGYLQGMQHLGDMIEQAWRASHYDILTERMGKEASALADKVARGTASEREVAQHKFNELVKGYWVQQKAGEYRHVNNFTKMFSNIGWFNIFRLGILPKALMQGLLHNPSAVAGLFRAQRVAQEDRQGKDTNYLSLFGAGKDLSQLYSGVVGMALGDPTMLGEYAFNTSLVGDFQKGAEELDNYGVKPLVNNVANSLRLLSPLANFIGDETTAFTKGLPQQTSKLSDQLVMLLLHTLLGSYATTKERPSAKQERKEEKNIQRNLGG